MMLSPNLNAFAVSDWLKTKLLEVAAEGVGLIAQI